MLRMDTRGPVGLSVCRSAMAASAMGYTALYTVVINILVSSLMGAREPTFLIAEHFKG